MHQFALQSWPTPFLSLFLSLLLCVFLSFFLSFLPAAWLQQIFIHLSFAYSYIVLPARNLQFIINLAPCVLFCSHWIKSLCVCLCHTLCAIALLFSGRTISGLPSTLLSRRRRHRFLHPKRLCFYSSCFVCARGWEMHLCACPRIKQRKKTKKYIYICWHQPFCLFSQMHA